MTVFCGMNHKSPDIFLTDCFLKSYHNETDMKILTESQSL